jgi:putative PIN family toxin of toxin-antitoxin system
VRIVLDTSTLISGLLWTGVPRRLIDAAIARQLELFTTDTLVAELEEVAARPKFAARMTAHEVTPAVLAQRYRAIAEAVVPAGIAGTVTADPDDDHVLACALAARADLVVSSDADLLNLKRYHEIPIVDPAEALRRIGQGARAFGEWDATS